MDEPGTHELAFGPVFLDACVLYPQVTRALLLGCAEARLYAPYWSSRVLNEWRIAALRAGGDGADAIVEQTVARLNDCFGASEVAGDPELERQLSLPDPADHHVLAATIDGGAKVLLTFNLRDFPRNRLAVHGIAARHPDSFLWEALSRFPGVIGPVIEGVMSELSETNGRLMLKRARLPRLAKLWAQAKGD